MLPRQYRLTRSRDIARVRRFGRSAGTPLVRLYVLPTRSAEPRVAFSVSKRVGKATVRNRVKRRLRESVRPHLRALAPGQDLVFIAREPAAAATFDRLEDTVDYLLRKTHAYARPSRSARNA